MKSIEKETKQKIFTDKKAVKLAFMSAVMLGLVSLFLTGVIISVVNDLYAFVKPRGEIEIFVPEGSTVDEIAETLGKSGVVKNPFVFSIYVRSKDKSEALEGISGAILLDSSMSYREILGTMIK